MLSQNTSKIILALKLIAVLAISNDAYAQKILNISVAGDMVYEHGYSSGSSAENRLEVRSVEASYYAPIDHNFDGFASLAAHYEDGETMFELHELVVSTSKLIPRSTVKVGQFFLGIGRLNQIHQHDWAFTSTPKVNETFFDKEGVFDTGLEYNWILPTSAILDLTFGITSGYTWGHTHTAGSKPEIPTMYVRGSQFIPFSTIDGLEYGLNYITRKDSNSNHMHLFGVDITSKIRKARMLAYLIQSEIWYRINENSTGDVSKQIGFYIFTDAAVADRLTLGVRWDSFKDLNKIDPVRVKNLNNIYHKLLGQITFHSSEFSKFRATISRELQIEEGNLTSADTKLALQTVLILGSHPAHDF